MALLAVLVACRPRHKEITKQDDEEEKQAGEMTESDTEALQPKDKKLYRPSESRAWIQRILICFGREKKYFFQNQILINSKDVNKPQS